MSIGLSSVEKRPQRGLRPGVVCRRLLVRYARLQGERVQLVAHSAAQRLINHLMLLHPALAAKRAGDDMRGIMVAIAAQILDRDLRVGQAVLDQPLDRRRVHRHPSIPAFRLTALTLRHVTRQPSLVCGLEVRDRYGTGPRKCQFGVGTPALDCADPPRRHPGALGGGGPSSRPSISRRYSDEPRCPPIWSPGSPIRTSASPSCFSARSTARCASAISPTPPITGVGRIALPLVSL